jgi:hypothetical protein
MKDNKIWKVENLESVHDDSEINDSEVDESKTDDKEDSSIDSDHL